MSNTMVIRPAQPRDCQDIHSLIVRLAVYEKEPAAVEGNVADLEQTLFAPDPAVYCHVAEQHADDGTAQIVGFACWYVTFSTWKVRHGIWLEDLFVDEGFRELGVGRRLLRALAEICVERGYPRLEWWVLDWNSAAHTFYRALGAEPQEEWTVWRLTGAALTRAASPASAGAG